MTIQNKFRNYTVEQFIVYITSKNLSKSEFELELNSTIVDQSQKEDILKKVDFAYNRINAPLDLQIRLLLIIFPFGILSVFTNSDRFYDAKAQQKLGFVKKGKQYYDFSILGVLLYISLILVVILFF